jgi:heme/copper-type cytochrome/quinol oxidase subunit 2
MTGRAGKTRNIWLVWLVWPLITLGVYYAVWWYKINREARDFDENIEVNPVLSVLAVTIGWVIIVPPYVSIYNTGQRIAKMQEDAGPQPSCNPWIGVLLAFVASLQALYYQSELNNLWAQLGNPEEGALVALPVAAGARTTGPITTPNIPPTETPLAGRPDTTR